MLRVNLFAAALKQTHIELNGLPHILNRDALIGAVKAACVIGSQNYRDEPIHIVRHQFELPCIGAANNEIRCDDRSLKRIANGL